MTHFQQNKKFELDNHDKNHDKETKNIDQYTCGVQNNKRKIVEEVLGNV